MNRARVLMLLPVLGAMILWVAGCEMPWESDDDDDPTGTSTIQGKVSDFVATTDKAANREGVVVYLEGVVDRSTTTGADGIFIFSGLPAGTYTLRFEFNGEEVRYRGNSGQMAQITLEADQRIELTGITISGGTVNIGNIRTVDLNPVSTSSSSDDDVDDAGAEETTTATGDGGGGGGATPAKMTITLGRGA